MFANIINIKENGDTEIITTTYIIKKNNDERYILTKNDAICLFKELKQYNIQCIEDIEFVYKKKQQYTPIENDFINKPLLNIFFRATTKNLSKNNTTFLNYKYNINRNNGNKYFKYINNNINKSVHDTIPFLSYYVSNIDDSVLYVYYDSFYKTFSLLDDISKIDFYYFDVRNIVSLEKMFYKNNNITEVNINFKIDNITSMSGMFDGCKNLKSCRITEINSNCTNFSGMFYNCENLQFIDFRSFIPSDKLLNLSFMFYNCRNIFYIMFLGISKTIDDNKTIANIKYINNVFQKCENLKNIYLDHFNTEYVNDMSYMFCDCISLEELDISKLNTSNTISFSNMFKNCICLPHINISNFITNNIKDMNNMFNNCRLLKNIDISNFNTNNVINVSGMFQNCLELKTITGISNINTHNIIMMDEMFNNCYNINELNLSNFYIDNVITMKNMFKDCYNLNKLNINNINTFENINDKDMFYGCCNLYEISIKNLDAKKITKKNNIIKLIYNNYNLCIVLCNKYFYNIWLKPNVNNYIKKYKLLRCIVTE